MQRSKTKVFCLERRAFVGLFSLGVFFIALYMYFISATVLDIVVRKELERDTASAYSRVSTLEQEYLLLKNNMTSTFAYEQGFYPIEEKQFVTRKALLTQAVAQTTE